MGESTTFAALGPLLLARKGLAKPALRNWQDEAEIAQDNSPDHSQGGEPAVRSQRKALVHWLAEARTDSPAQKGRTRRAAFTLRLDEQRHLKLKLASAVTGESAQQIVTEALDRLLADMPEIEALAVQARRKDSKA